jgi:hypothetical protein
MKTTYEMDGLFTEEDIKNRNTVVFQCTKCNKWTTHCNWIPGGQNKHVPCSDCGAVAYDGSSIKSLRTYNPLTDNKRRMKKK